MPGRVSLAGLALPLSLIGYAGERPATPEASASAGTPAVMRPGFETNVGQAVPDVRFLARGSAGVYAIGDSSARLVLSPQAKSSNGGQRTTLGWSFVGANAAPAASGESLLPGVFHYLRGTDRGRWHTGVARYERVVQRDVYPGIDVVYYLRDGLLEHDLVVAPGADPERIVVELEGASELALSSDGSLAIETGGPAVTMRAPVAYQGDGTSRRSVAARYRLLGSGRYGFVVGAHEASQPLVIDPVLVYSTHLGGSLGVNPPPYGMGVTAIDEVDSIAVDGTGNAYVVGTTASLDFPGAGAPQASNAGDYDVFVTKLDPSGRLLHSTFLGGSGADKAEGVAVAPDGSVYVVGETWSSNFPTARAFQPSLHGASDAFVTKLDPSGSSIVFSTYLGGSYVEYASGAVVDASGGVAVAGATHSADFPTLAPLQSAQAGGYDVFLVRFGPTGSLLYSTYLGGNAHDQPCGIGLEPDGGLAVAGWTVSTDFPTVAALQTKLNDTSPDPLLGGDLFVARLDPSGTRFIYSTYFGGSGVDRCAERSGGGLSLDALGSAYIAGQTQSADFPTLRPLQAALRGSKDAFVAKLDPAGALAYSTYLGGTGGYYCCSIDGDTATGVAVDSSGRAHVVGWTYSDNFPLVSPLQGYERMRGSYDAFAAVLGPAGDSLELSTLFGGGSEEEGLAVATDAADSTYLGGWTFSNTMPKVNPVQPGVAGGPWDAFVAKIAPSSAGPVVSVADALIGRRSPAPRQLTFPVTLSVPSSGTVTVRYQTADLSAKAGVDYVANAGTLAFAPGTTRQDVNVSVLDGAVDDMSTRTVSLEMDTIRGAGLSRAHAVGTIVPGDAPRSTALWSAFFAVDARETPYVGDFDGDGKTDIITFTRDNPLAVGDVYVARSLGDRFEPVSQKWHDWFAISADETVVIGDYDGDGKADIATWLGRTTRQVYVALSTGKGMAHEAVWLDSAGASADDVIEAGDVDGDGRADLIIFERRLGKVLVALSTGSSFLPPQQWHGFFAVSTYERPRVGDVNGDGKADILTFATDSPTAFGDVYVALSDGKRFVDLNGLPDSSSKWHDWFAIRPSEEVRVGDLDGDGADDLFTFLPPPWGQCYTVRSLGYALGDNVLWREIVTPSAADVPFVGDVNGDGKADIVVFAKGEGRVYVSLAP